MFRKIMGQLNLTNIAVTILIVTLDRRFDLSGQILRAVKQEPVR